MKPKLLLHFVLALIWAAINGSMTLSTLLVGFVLGYLVILLFEPLLRGEERYGLRFFHWIGLVLWLIKSLVTSSVKVAVDVLSPSTRRIEPGIIAVPLDLKTDFGITLMANLISLTPGTLSIDVSPDKKKLYIHNMYITDRNVEKVTEEIYQDVQERVMVMLGKLPPPKRRISGNQDEATE